MSEARVPWSGKAASLAAGGYPLRAIILLAAALVIAVLFAVLPVSRGLAWVVGTVVALGTAGLVAARTWQVGQAARDEAAHMLAALGTTTADLPDSLRTRMPLVIVTGDALGQLFDVDGYRERLVRIGDGVIWLRVTRAQDLPRLTAALRQWRAGRAPEAVVLSIAPALHACEDALAQRLRVIRQAIADARRMTGARLPSYVALYQRLMVTPAADGPPQWYGVSTNMRLAGVQHFDAFKQASADPGHAAALASVIDWTQRAVIGPLTDGLQPAAPCTPHGVSWIDCGPASAAGTPWARHVQAHTRVVPPPMPASVAPWPLPQPLIEALPQRPWVSPSLAAVAHAIALLACALALAIWGSARNNQALLTHIGTDLSRYSMIPPAHDSARRDALQALITDRDLLDHYGRIGVPLRLSFGMYRAAALTPVLNDAIASYQPPPPLPTVVTLDSMALFDSGRAQLNPGSTRVMVSALDLIKLHPDKRILVAGYTDNIGDPDSNLKLSVARAGAVRDWLVEASGIAATQFATQGYGDTRPIADNGTRAGRAKNRRVEITLVPDTRDNPETHKVSNP
jgi:outer membrane protein OmpA-like peptidoglycan-associated protein